MLPEVRQTDYLHEVPKLELNRNYVLDFAEELNGFHDNFADCFHRSESRENIFRCMSRQFSQLERKSYVMCAVT